MRFGDLVFYNPDISTLDSNYLSTFDEHELSRGAIGIFISMGENFEKFVKGFEPMNILFTFANGSSTRIVRIYEDEVGRITI